METSVRRARWLLPMSLLPWWFRPRATNSRAAREFWKWNGSDPPFWTAWIGCAGWAHVRSPCHSREGSLPSKYPCGKAWKSDHNVQARREESPAVAR